MQVQGLVYKNLELEVKTTTTKAAILSLVSTANIGAGSEGYRAGGGLGKCKSWSLCIQG